jgi:alkylated DNA nucleotide flippase Atl1
MDEFVAEHVLRLVERIPRGRVVSYGDIGHIVGIGPRQVGAVMSRYGSGVTWWRVTNSSGMLPEHILEEARAHWFDEGIPVQTSGRGCQISRARADLSVLETEYRAAVADLEHEGDPR